ncbi:amidohydrolase [Saccharothrix violaceirubra]|uniref:Amidohydrolase 3 domain-containing protein n=1 Tax=Saccharothrix violaceirubra TaxID=413306 RepID=A0A7W7WYB1_9PSEU|nr:amidohydrolase [Saccharothrix violaceirubra]MBB4968027.1 hypothetical protein [Saccharothrix violaceirubra]
MILDLKLVDAQVLTMDPNTPSARSIGVWQGRIVELDTDLPARRVVGLDGATVLPGFVDPHNHLAWAGRAARTVSVTHCATVAEILDLLRTVPRKAGWLEAAGYDHRTLDRPLTARDLDTVGTKVFVQDLSGHACVVSGDLLVGLPEAVLAQAQRDADGLTGFLAEAGHNAVRALRLPYPLDEVTADIEAGVRECLRQGIVLAAEAGVGGGLIGSTPLEVAAYQRADLPIRVQLMVSATELAVVRAHPSDLVRRALPLGLRTGLGDSRLSIGALKVWTDGGMMARTAALTRPYVGMAGSGMLADTEDDLRDAIVDGHRAGWQLAVHAIGDRAVDFALAALAEAQAVCPRPDARHRIEHAGLTRPDQLVSMAELGVIPVVQPAFLYAYGDDYAAIMGADREDWLYRGRSFLDHGLTLVGSSDRPVADGNPLRGIQFMVDRASSSGRVIGVGEGVSVAEALLSYTTRGAYACHMEGELGSLVSGKLGDFVVLGDDPRTAGRIADVPVLATVVGGRAVFDPHGLFG